MHTRVRADRVEAGPPAPAPDAPSGSTHPLLAIQRTAGNAAVNQLLRATVKATPTPKATGPIDLQAVAARWRDRLQAPRKPLGEVRVSESAEEVQGLLEDWDEMPFGGKELREAEALVDALAGSPDTEDQKLHLFVANAVEQQTRRAAIAKQVKKLSGRAVLAVIADGRLEAACTWTLVTGQARADAKADANWWVPGWRRCLYVEELSSASWNVGWPSEEAPVRGAGSALVAAIVAKANALDCHGIGLFALDTNLGFYEKVEFTPQPDRDRTMVRQLKEPDEEPVEEQPTRAPTKKKRSKGCVVS